jgi:hypothetical protein
MVLKTAQALAIFTAMDMKMVVVTASVTGLGVVKVVATGKGRVAVLGLIMAADTALDFLNTFPLFFYHEER